MKTYEEIISQCENYKSLLSNCCYHIERNQFQDSIPLLVNIYNDVKPHESRLKDGLENYVWAGNDYPHDARALLDIVEYYKQNETIISHWENVHNKDNRPKQEEPQQNPLTESLFIEKVKNGQLKGNDIYKYFETYEPRAAKNLLEEMEIIALAHFSDINGVHERLNKACEIIKEVFPEVKQSSLYPEDEQESGGQKKDKQSANNILQVFPLYRHSEKLTAIKCFLEDRKFIEKIDSDSFLYWFGCVEMQSPKKIYWTSTKQILRELLTHMYGYKGKTLVRKIGNIVPCAFNIKDRTGKWVNAQLTTDKPTGNHHSCALKSFYSTLLMR